MSLRLGKGMTHCPTEVEGFLGSCGGDCNRRITLQGVPLASVRDDNKPHSRNRPMALAPQHPKFKSLGEGRVIRVCVNAVTA